MIAAVAAVATLGAAAAIAWLRWRVVVIAVEGPSMLPALDTGDRLVIRRVPADRLAVGDVVVVEMPYREDGGWHWPPPGGGLAGRRWAVKRVAALAGGPVPAGCLVVLGDNPGESVDSRLFGPVPVERVLGVAARSRSAQLE